MNKTLPYSFDLFFDIKTHRELRRIVNESENKLNEIAEMLKDHKMEHMFPDIFCEYEEMDNTGLYYQSCDRNRKPVSALMLEDEKYCRFCGKIIVESKGESCNMKKTQ